MKINKGISVLLASVLIGGMLVGCSSEFDSTEYLDEQGKQLIKKYEDREKYDYIKVESLDYMSESLYKDKYIMITGKVTDIDKDADNGNSYSISFSFEENYTTAFIKVFINKNRVDVKFNKGDIITVYGRCYGIQTKRYGDESFDYWHINAYFLELGDTTNKDINTKDKAIKETTDNKDVATESQPQKKITVNVSEQATDKRDGTPKEDNNKSTQKDTNQKETKSTKEATQKKSNENTTKEDKKEEPKQKGYYVTCSNGHKVWTVNGDYDCQQCYDDYMNQEDDETDECSICGSHVGVKQMCECDGTIHHRSCHVDAYTCPSCGRTGLNNDPDVYGCPYCGYPNEEHQESSDVEEYNDEVDIPNDTNEGINY